MGSACVGEWAGGGGGGAGRDEFDAQHQGLYLV